MLFIMTRVLPRRSRFDTPVCLAPSYELLGVKLSIEVSYRGSESIALRKVRGESTFIPPPVNRTQATEYYHAKIEMINGYTR
jgi:hypothetical protein